MTCNGGKFSMMVLRLHHADRQEVQRAPTASGFRRAGANEAGKILDIAPPFVPYVHQITAFERLTGKDNHQPQHALVTTGTGSGKTECFLYPLLTLGGRASRPSSSTP
jgi:ATP-dependent helicase YprA (DUF1998 family)